MSDKKTSWSGGSKPYNASYGKLMMWFFLISDALTFSGFLTAYGFARFKFLGEWPLAEEVFTHFPGLHGDHPLLYVALMTFILIMSSVTMVLAVHNGNQMKKNAVAFWLFLTIIGGATFVGSQAWEWMHFIHGDYGSIKTSNGSIIHIVDDTGHKVSLNVFKDDVDSHSLHDDHGDSHSSHHANVTKDEFSKNLNKFPHLSLRLKDKSIVASHDIMAYLGDDYEFVFGANLKHNEYGNTLFANFFFFITGFHGFHVFSGVIINIIIFIMVIKNILHKRGHYEMVEKVGLYWHFVDLVWVFVFTFFYLV